MSLYRLINNVFKYHEAYLDFPAMRRQFDGVKHWFSHQNITIKDKLIDRWEPVAIEFSSDRKKNLKPHISVWATSALVMSGHAKSVLEKMLEDQGEFLEAQDDYWLFNCLQSVDGSVVDAEKSSFEIDIADSVSQSKTLVLKEPMVEHLPLFKPGFEHNAFLICNQEFKDLVEENDLGGLIFEKDLAFGYVRDEE